MFNSAPSALLGVLGEDVEGGKKALNRIQLLLQQSNHAIKKQTFNLSACWKEKKKQALRTHNKKIYPVVFNKLESAMKIACTF